MTNPLAVYRSNMFGSRGVDVGAALEYVDQLATASSDPVAVQTAARVLLNTLIGAVDQILTSHSPERLALIELIDERIAASASNIDQQINDWMDDNVDHDDLIHNWMSNNLTDEIESVIKNSLTFTVSVD